MTIFLDFDGTLYDTGRQKRWTREVFSRGGISAERFNETYQQLVDGFGYHPVAHVELLSGDWRDDGARQAALAAAGEMLVEGASYVFEGIPELLTALRDRGERLVLLTRGDVTWQRTKLDGSGLAALLDEVEMTTDRKFRRLAELVGENETAVVVDDNPGELAEMIRVRPRLRYIYFRRLVNPYEGPGCEVAASVAELRVLLLK
jgi:FMN phosphatase YigB (HAD superfamily)